MRKLLLLGLVGCWTSSSKPPSQPKPVERGASTGGATYGGATYGGLVALTGTGLGDVDGVPLGLSGGGGGAIGTISGTGLGVGPGGGVGRGGGANPPAVSSGGSGQNGTLDPEVIRRSIRQNMAQITQCYEQVLLADPSLAGKVTVSFTIGPDGKVLQATGSGMPPVEACVASVIAAIQFPAPNGGGRVVVNYPFIFSSASP